MIDTPENYNDVELELTKSGLVYCEETIVKHNKKGTVTGRHNIQDIKVIQIKKSIDNFALILAVILIFASTVCYLTIDQTSWKIGISLPLLLLACFFLMGAQTSSILIKTSGGEIMYNCSDQIEEGQGFCVSINEKINSKDSSIKDNQIHVESQQSL